MINMTDRIIESDKSGRENKFIWQGKEVTVKRTISLEEMVRFVGTVINTIFNNGEYLPEYRIPAEKLCVLTSYTDIQIDSLDDDSYSLIYDSDIIREVMSRINREQVSDIIRTIDKKISDSLSIRRESAEKEISELCSYVKKMNEDLENAMSGVSLEDIRNLADTMLSDNDPALSIVKSNMSEK